MNGVIKKYLIYFVILSILGGIIIFSINWNRNKTFKTINIKGLITLKENEILNILDSSVFKIPKNQLKLNEIKSKLLLNKMVEAVSLTSGSNDELLIEIKEKEPFSYVILKDYSFFAYKNGDSLSSELGNFYPDLIIYRLNSLKNNQDSIEYSNINRFVNNLDAENRKLISEVYFNNQELMITLNINSIQVNLGLNQNCNSNFDKLIELLKKKKDINYSKVNYIDTRWTDRLVINEIN